MGLMIPLIAIDTDGELTSSNVSLSTRTYSSTIAWRDGELAYDATTHMEYESLDADASATVTFTVGASDPIVVNKTSHGLGAGSKVNFTTTGTLPAPLVVATSYYVLANDANSFKLAATPGGSEITSPAGAAGSGTHTLFYGTNTGNAQPVEPDTENAHWTLIGKTNKWAMFDNTNITKTTNTTSIVVGLTLADRFDTVILMGLANASSVRIQGTNGYDTTYSLTETAFTDSWYNGTYSPSRYKDRLGVSDISPTSGNVLTITISGTGTVECGSCLVGLSIDIGGAQYGAEIGIDNWSNIERDPDFGTIAVLATRGYSDNASYNIFVPKNKAAALRNLFAVYKDEAVGFLLTPNDDSPGDWDGLGIHMAIIRTFRFRLEHPGHYLYSLEVDGLT